MAKRVTIADVAEKAGVSTGTVSAVLNARPTVRRETRQRVLYAIDHLGYLPSASAQQLGSGGDGATSFPPSVGIVVKQIDSPFYAEVVKGADAELTDRGYVPFICTSGGDSEREGQIIDSLRGREVRGAIVAPVLDEDVDLSRLFLLRRSGFPFVLLEIVPGLKANAVSVDNLAASQEAVQYLIGLGHRRIVHFTGPASARHSRERRMGFEKAFSQSPLQVSDDAVIPVGSVFEDGFEAGLRHFRDADPATRPTAVSCFNDLVALGLIHALTELGLRVPEDVSVVGFDDIPAATQTLWPLTTIHVPQREMGKQAVDIVLDQMDEASSADDPVVVTLDFELAIRKTTAPPAPE